MQAKETKWTPMKALGKAQKEIESLGIPVFKTDLSEREGLDFSRITNSRIRC